MRKLITASIAGLALAGAALLVPTAGHAAPVEAATPPSDSACRTANTNVTAVPADASAGHRHYTVTVAADPGTTPCVVRGFPTPMVFVDPEINERPVTVTTVGTPQPVVLAPNHPIHYDIRTRNVPGGTPIEYVGFHVPTDQHAFTQTARFVPAIALNSPVQVSGFHA